MAVSKVILEEVCVHEILTSWKYSALNFIEHTLPKGKRNMSQHIVLGFVGSKMGA